LLTVANYLVSLGLTSQLADKNEIYCMHKRRMTRPDSLVYSMKQCKAGFIILAKRVLFVFSGISMMPLILRGRGEQKMTT
jgi:hypothetical protein